MRTKRTMVVALAMLMLSALAFAGVAGAKEKDKDFTSFTLVAHHGSVDPGWEDTWTAELRTVDGDFVGRAGGRCMALGAADLDICDMVIRLPEGDITATAAENDSTILYAVTGGTATFQTVQGEIEDVLATVEPLVTHMTFQLTGVSVDY